MEVRYSTKSGSCGSDSMVLTENVRRKIAHVVHDLETIETASREIDSFDPMSFYRS